jgi:hypothetical protein
MAAQASTGKARIRTDYDAMDCAVRAERRRSHVAGEALRFQSAGKR